MSVVDCHVRLRETEEGTFGDEENCPIRARSAVGSVRDVILDQHFAFVESLCLDEVSGADPAGVAERKVVVAATDALSVLDGDPRPGRYHGRVTYVHMIVRRRRKSLSYEMLGDDVGFRVVDLQIEVLDRLLRDVVAVVLDTTGLVDRDAAGRGEDDDARQEKSLEHGNAPSGWLLEDFRNHTSIYMIMCQARVVIVQELGNSSRIQAYVYNKPQYAKRMTRCSRIWQGSVWCSKGACK